MPRKSDRAPIRCEFFTWRLFERDGVWYADARGGKHNLGKHSLGTRDREEALAILRRLDRQKAVELGLAATSRADPNEDLPIEKGWALFVEHCNRPEVMGGVSPSTLKRYRAVRDKHLAFGRTNGLKDWHQIDKRATEAYGRWLKRKGYADRSLYLELTLIKSVNQWLIDEGHLPESCRFKLKLRRPDTCDAYCYSRAEFGAMLAHCRAKPELNWLADVLIVLACTGLRISELAALRRSDVDLASNAIRLADERGSSRRERMGTARRTKGRRSRTLPIHPQVREVLEQLPYHPDGRLLHGPRGGRLKPDTVRNVLVREVIMPLKEKFPTPAGEIGFEHGRVHSLRHFFVTQAFLGGATEGEIMEWVGHRDSKMVAHYRHLRNEDSHRRMQQIEFFGKDDSNQHR